MSQPSASTPSTTTNSTARRPRISLAIATAFGLGYLPKAPGTWGSLAGILIYALTQFYFPLDSIAGAHLRVIDRVEWAALTILPVSVAIALVGVWCAGRAAVFLGNKDPQFVVIDEVSGQHLTYVLSLTLPNWKYLLLGFILFRVFDIWKPFPARQAESLPGGLGIMADDWIAGIYAALGLWIARAAGI
jgi:phosphatidylglycerophosphatase A